jgi:hypothetical protein
MALFEQENNVITFSAKAAKDELKSYHRMGVISYNLPH